MMSEEMIRDYAHKLFLMRKYSMDEQVREAAHQRFLAVKLILSEWDEEHTKKFKDHLNKFAKSVALQDE